MLELKKVKIKIKNYKCFAEQEHGFEAIYPINIIIGKNNSGKSSLIDLIEYVVSPHAGLKNLGYLGREPEVIISQPLEESELSKAFPKDRSGGGIPGNNQWEFGKKYIGSYITYKLQQLSERNFIRIEPPLSISHPKEYENIITKNSSLPFQNKNFKRISSERDIVPEGDTGPKVNYKGVGATNIIQNFINKTILPSDLVEKKLLEELNKILEPELFYSDLVVQQDTNNFWEIYLEERNKGRIALSKMGSGIKTILLVLINLYLIPSLEKKDINTYIFGFEELENNIHPAMQRKLFYYLKNFAIQNGTIFFISTHSNVVIDLFNKDSEAQLIHVVHDGQSSKSKKVITYFDNKGILDDLDIRASDLLQSNSIIWLEEINGDGYCKSTQNILCNNGDNNSIPGYYNSLKIKKLNK